MGDEYKYMGTSRLKGSTCKEYDDILFANDESLPNHLRMEANSLTKGWDLLF